jgi:hypothetical protein
LSVATQAVDCIDLSYRFATDLAADRVNRSIAPGEMYGPLGPNGIHDQDDHHAADPGGRQALRGLLIGTAIMLWLDTVVLVGATILSITCASLPLPSLANR